MKVNISPKSPRIELSNDTFAERKRCQVIAYESETFRRRRPNGVSHCENGEQNPQTYPPLAGRGPPSNTVMPRPAATVEVLSHTYAVKSPLVTMARPKFAPKVPPSRGPIAKSHYLPHPWTRPTYDAKWYPDPIRRFSTMHLSDQPRHVRTGPTDRPRESLMTIARYASNESDAA